MSNQRIYLRVQDVFKNINYVSVVGDSVRYTSASGTPLALSNLLGEATFEAQARLANAQNASEAQAMLQAAAGKGNQISVFDATLPQGYTVFLREADGTGTTHVSYQEGDRDEAVRLAMIECRADWGWEEHGSDEDDDLHVLGVAAGDVTIIEWDDLE